MNLALKEGAKPLAPASRQRVREAIAAIVAVLGAVEDHYCESTTAYEHVSQLGDAVALLHVLRDGIEARDEQFRRLEAGRSRRASSSRSHRSDAMRPRHDVNGRLPVPAEGATADEGESAVVDLITIIRREA